ncbi:MAG: DUF4384 domain-containing protein [Oscillatoria sp. PMC 1068.18]|nr:DUF4384 domain-containing protein [Oscillatoria sp. PMC 1076.18]MEC4990157.1 DUF4384 domain-containing protein [Oscillatoria sp. PMC 1068.18]
MKIPDYAENEAKFLEAMATKYGFNDKTRLAFLQRFREANADLNNKNVAETSEIQLLEGTKEGSDPATILRDRLVVICDELAKDGCDYGDISKGKWKIAKQWLRQVKYPEWVKKQIIDSPGGIEGLLQLWQQLVELATKTTQMGVVLADTLDLYSPYQECIKLGTNIRLEMKLERPGYVLVLEKGTSGRLWCLCPSSLAPKPFFPAGVSVLPQPGSSQKSFKITGNVGIEQVLAVVSQEPPQLDWLPEGKDKPLQLGEKHLQNLREYLQQSNDCQVLYTEYTVVA